MQEKEGYKTKIETFRCGDCRGPLTNTGNQRPKYLKCLHAFCGNCTAKIITDSLFCPVCKMSVSSDDSFLDTGLFQNLRRFETIVQQLQQNAVRHSECQNCSDGNVATYWCTEPDMPLLFCIECVHIHNNFNMSEREIFVSLQNTSPEDILAYVRPKKNTHCEKHDEDLELFCEECMTSFCRNCDHNGHPMVYINDEAEDIRNRMDNKIQDSLKSIEIFQRRLKYIKSEKERLKVSSKKTTEHIHQFFDKLKKSIDERKDELINKVTKITHEKSVVLEEDLERTRFELYDVSRFIEFLKAANQFGNGTDLIHINGHFKTRSADYISTRLADEPDANGSISFGSGQFTEIRLPLLQAKNFDAVLKRIPGSVERLGEIKETTTSASETKFRINEIGSGLEIVVEAYMKNQQPCNHGGDFFIVDIRDPHGKISTPLLVDLNTGSYSTNFTPRVAGNHRISISFHGRPIHRSPYIFEMEEEEQQQPYSNRYNYVNSKQIPNTDPPPPPVPTTPRPVSSGNSGYVTMKGNGETRPRSNTVNSKVANTRIGNGYGVDDTNVGAYLETRRGSRRGSYIYQTIDSLGLDVKKKDEMRLDALDEKDLESLRENFKPTRKKKKSTILPWRKSQGE